MLRSNEDAISVGAPLTISAVDDLHVEFGFSVVLVGVGASPSCATHARTLNGVQSGCATAVSIGFDPIDLNAPIASVFSSIAVLALAEGRRAEASGTDGIDVSVNTGVSAGEINIVLHTATEKVEGCLCGHRATTVDSPAAVNNSRVAVSSCQIAGFGAESSRRARRRRWGGWRRGWSGLVAAASEATASIISFASC